MKTKQTISFKQIIIGLVGLSLVILVHELGHFIACKIFGVGTPVFSIGFGPSLFNVSIGQTMFQIAAFPIGGYVSLSETDFAAQPYIHQLIIMLAGIVCNLLFAFGVFLSISAQGKHVANTTIDSIHDNSPAQNIGLQPGDSFISIDGKNVENNPHKLIQKILNNAGKTITLEVVRNGKKMTFETTIEQHHPNLGPNLGWLGVQLDSNQIKPPSTKQIVTDSISHMKGNTQNIQRALQKLFRENGNNSGIVGPIGIISIAGKSISYGIHFFFLILAILSLNVAFFNLLPIPFLDGGKIVSITYTHLFGPISPMIGMVVSRIFLAMLIMVLLFITLKDMNFIRGKK